MQQGKYYPPYEASHSLCVKCHYARMRTDICGIYCTGGFVKEDGTCDRFKPYKAEEERRKKRCA